jgi:hypothetical protein
MEDGDAVVLQEWKMEMLSSSKSKISDDAVVLLGWKMEMLSSSKEGKWGCCRPPRIEDRDDAVLQE